MTIKTRIIGIYHFEDIFGTKLYFVDFVTLQFCRDTIYYSDNLITRLKCNEICDVLEKIYLQNKYENCYNPKI